MKAIFLAALGIAGCIAFCDAQSFDIQQQRSSFEEFKSQLRSEFDDFRRQTVQEYADFLSDPWKEFKQSAPIPTPHREVVPPSVLPEDNRTPPEQDREVKVEEVVKPITAPYMQPEPTEPVMEIPTTEQKKVKFTFYRTPMLVRFDKAYMPSLSRVDEQSVADAFRKLGSNEATENLLYDCLQLRSKHHLCDWAYLQVLQCIANEVCPNDPNRATLLTAYLYTVSGYKMRLAHDGQMLYMLYSSHHVIFEKPSFEMDGERYYCLAQETPVSLKICRTPFPNEQPLSLVISEPPLLEMTEGMDMTLTGNGVQFEDTELTYVVNLNVIDFYDTYPCSYIGDDIMTKWAIYANTALDPNVKRILYSAPISNEPNLSTVDIVNRLLDLIQSLPYEFDEKVWGYDRVFFPDETLSYLICDCDDRAVLFSRMVRDMLGLNCILVYYPGHLACGVDFGDEEIRGDYIMHKGRKYMVCDPTCVYATVGVTQPGMDNATAKVILLQ